MSQTVGSPTRPVVAPKPEVSEQAELLGFFHLLARRRAWALGTLLTVLILSLLYCFLVPPAYEATAEILMRSSSTTPSVSGLASAFGLGSSGGFDLETAARVLESWTLQSAALALLKAHPQFFREWTEGKRTCQTIVDIPPEVAETYSRHPQITAVPDLYKNIISELSVKQVGASNIVRLRTVSTDLLAACDYINALCAAYLLWRQERTRFRAELALRELSKQLKDAEAKLQEAEDRLEEFQRTHRIVDAQAQATDLVTRLSKLQDQVATLEAGLRAQRAQDQYLERQIEQTQDTQVASTVIANNPLVQQMRKTLFDLYTQRAQLLQEYTEESQKVKAIDGQIEEVKRKLADTVKTIVSSRTQTPNPLRNTLIAQYAQGRAATIALEARLPALRSLLQQLREQVDQLPPEARQLAALKREVQIQQQRYLTLRQQQQAQEANREQMVADEAVLASAQVLPWAPPSPVRPRKLITILLALILGTMLGVVAAILADQLDPTYHSLELAEAEVGLPTVGIIPTCPGGVMPLVIDPGSPLDLRRAFVALATNLQLAKPGAVHQVIAVTGTRREEGRTSVAANLAISLAMMGRDVLLLDCDLDHPDVAQLFGVQVPSTLSDVISGAATLESARVRVDPQVPLSIMTAGLDPASFASWVGTPAVLEMLDELRKHHDLIVIDLGPCRETNEVPWLCSLSDITVLLLVLGSSSRADMIRAQSLLVRAGAQVVGMVVNRQGTIPNHHDAAT